MYKITFFISLVSIIFSSLLTSCSRQMTEGKHIHAHESVYAFASHMQQGQFNLAYELMSKALKKKIAFRLSEQHKIGRKEIKSNLGQDARYIDLFWKSYQAQFPFRKISQQSLSLVEIDRKDDERKWFHITINQKIYEITTRTEHSGWRFEGIREIKLPSDSP